MFFKSRSKNALSNNSLPYLEKIAEKIDTIIQSLSHDPYPHGCKKLQGYDNIYRVRYSDYRIVYSVEAKKLVIEIIQIGDSKDIYKKL